MSKNGLGDSENNCQWAFSIKKVSDELMKLKVLSGSLLRTLEFVSSRKISLFNTELLMHFI